MGRLLMNVLLAGGGYAWTAVPQRDAYMAVLEAASIRQDIVPFAGFLADLVETGISGGPAARGRKGRCQWIGAVRHLRHAHELPHRDSAALTSAWVPP